jgi:ankyrin repeat protein
MNKKDILIDIIQKQDLVGLKDFVKNEKDFTYDFTTLSGQTLLHLVASKLTSQTLGTIQILLEKGIDPLAVDEKFKTALDIAKESNNIPAMTIMKHFINKKIQEQKTYF